SAERSGRLSHSSVSLPVAHGPCPGPGEWPIRSLRPLLGHPDGEVGWLAVGAGVERDREETAIAGADFEGWRAFGGVGSGDFPDAHPGFRGGSSVAALRGRGTLPEAA